MVDAPERLVAGAVTAGTPDQALPLAGAGGPMSTPPSRRETLANLVRSVRPSPLVARGLLLLIAASLVLSVALEPLVSRTPALDPDAIREALQGTGAVAPLAFVAVVVLAILVAPIPSIPLDIAAGLTFGWWWGWVLTLLGDVIGALIAFQLARYLGQRWLLRRLGSNATVHIERLQAGLTPRMLLVTRLLPVFSFEWVSYAAGLTTMRASTFVVVTTAGTAGPVMLLVAVGDLLVTRPGIAAATFGGLAAVTVLPLAWWARPQRERIGTPSEAAEGVTSDVVV